MSDLEQAKAGISRRTLTKGAAWAVPAVLVAQATPAFAASPGKLQVTGNACKLPGNSNPTYKGNVFGLTATNSFNSPISITITSIVLAGSNLGAVGVLGANCVNLGNPFTVPANSSIQIAAVTADAGNSQNGTIQVSYTFTGGGGPGGSGMATATATSVPPVNGGCRPFAGGGWDCITTF